VNVSVGGIKGVGDFVGVRLEVGVFETVPVTVGDIVADCVMDAVAVAVIVIDAVGVAVRGDGAKPKAMPPRQ
jgi:hypothetical protein